MKKFLFLSVFVLHGFMFGMNDKSREAITALANKVDPETGLALLNAACVHKLPLEQVETLLSHGANPNIACPNGQMYKGNYPLHYAAIQAAKGDELRG